MFKELWGRAVYWHISVQSSNMIERGWAVKLNGSLVIFESLSNPIHLSEADERKGQTYSIAKITVNDPYG